jgi:uncharacterized protein YecT (DUF1311 family)
MTAACSALMSGLPAKAKQQLQLSQGAWLAFRDAEGGAIGDIFETRHGEGSDHRREERDETAPLTLAARLLQPLSSSG